MVSAADWIGTLYWVGAETADRETEEDIIVYNGRAVGNCNDFVSLCMGDEER